MTSFLTNKIFFLVIIFINLKLPLNNYFDIIVVSFLVAVLLCFKKKTFIKTKTVVIINCLIVVLTIFNLQIPKNFINESHSIFLTSSDVKVLERFMPKDIFQKLNMDYKNNFDIERLLKSTNKYNVYEEDGSINKNESINKFNNFKTIYNPIAFSSDNFFQKSKFTRKVNNINFDNREELRLGVLNTSSYNLLYDKEFRRILPYYVLFEIPNSAKNSEVCAKGRLFYTYDNSLSKNNYIKDLNFEKINSGECLKINENFNSLFILGYSINQSDEISLKLEKNLTLKFYDVGYKIIILIIFLLFIYYFFSIKNSLSIYTGVYFVSLVTTVIITYFKDYNQLFGLRYFRGGADGLLHASKSYEIVKDLFNQNIYWAIQGGEEIFYFMPGLRYFGALCNIIFGDTNYGYILLGTLLPLFIFIIFKNLINKKISLYLVLSFIFFPIFENIGFGFFNYIGQITRNHAETFSITMIVIAIAYLSSKDFIKERNFLYFFLISTLLSFATIARPNFFPTTIILSMYLCYLCLTKKDFFKLFFAVLGFSFSFLPLVHNVYFGQSYHLFTISKAHFLFSDFYTNIDPSNLQSTKLFIQLSKWNPIYNFHRLIFLIIVVYYILKYRQTMFIYSLFLCCIAQHGVLILTHPDSRYAYLAWLLTFILFIKILFDYNLISKLYYKLFSR